MSHVFVPRSQRAESSVTLSLEEVRQEATPVGRRTTTAIGRVNLALGPRP